MKNFLSMFEDANAPSHIKESLIKERRLDSFFDVRGALLSTPIITGKFIFL